MLDTSALLALRDDEPGAERVHRIIAAARKRRASAYVSFMTRMELLYRIASSEDDDAAAAALPVHRQAILVHKDPEFSALAGLRQEHLGD